MKLRIRNVTQSTMLADRADIADTSATRRTGLLKRTELVEGEGLWIVPCEGIHTFRMKFPIDVLFIDRKRTVLAIRPNMKRRRIAMRARWLPMVLWMSAVSILLTIAPMVDASFALAPRAANWVDWGFRVGAALVIIWGFRFLTTAQSVVELPVGTIERSRTAVGDQLELERYEG